MNDTGDDRKHHPVPPECPPRASPFPPSPLPHPPPPPPRAQRLSRGRQVERRCDILVGRRRWVGSGMLVRSSLWSNAMATWRPGDMATYGPDMPRPCVLLLLVLVLVCPAPLCLCPSPCSIGSQTPAVTTHWRSRRPSYTGRSIIHADTLSSEQQRMEQKLKVVESGSTDTELSVGEEEWTDAEGQRSNERTS